MNEKRYIAHESLTIGTILSAVGGILESHSFLFRDRVFANSQTGNISLMALSILNADFKNSLKHALPIVAFIAGVALAELIKKTTSSNKKLKWPSPILILEIVFLFLAGFIPKNCQNSIVTTSISFVCSLQISGFKLLKGLPFATTMCTGDLRSASANISNAILNKDKESAFIGLRYVLIVASFFTGVLAGGAMTSLIGKTTLWICSALLTLAFILIVIKNSQQQDKN